MSYESKPQQGFPDAEVREYEKKHRQTARKAASEGMVLLRNKNHLLPLEKGRKIALFGAGAGKTVKGGTGSGDVNERETVTIREGLENAGFKIVTEDWLNDYEDAFFRARKAWKNCILDKADPKNMMAFFESYSTTPFIYPEGDPVCAADTDTAVYVISRIAGEGRDRQNQEGDYCLFPKEEKDLSDLCRFYEHVIAAVNTGGQIDLSFMDRNPKIEALLVISQPGQEGGNAFADILAGNVTPSGKLTDTWAYSYDDYPSSASFSGNDGHPERNVYQEGIYVGYRYFDSFDIPVRCSFGYGMSYTDFSIHDVSTEMREDNVSFIVMAKVTNKGTEFTGKETVQVYVSCPDGKLEKEYRRLAGFVKTGLLKPGASEEISIPVSMAALASYDPSLPGWMLEKGFYGIWVGSSLAGSVLSGAVYLDADRVTEHTKNICVPEKEIEELALTSEKRKERYERWTERLTAENRAVLKIDGTAIPEVTDIYKKNPLFVSQQVWETAGKLTDEQMILLVTGDVGKGQGAALGSAGISVPGSAGETSDCAKEIGVKGCVLADGPAGLRLEPSFRVRNGIIQKKDFCCSIEHGFFSDAAGQKAEDADEGKCETRYQYCTAFPVGTLLAQSWNADLVREVGTAVADEMKRFHVTLWLAPGMNIHRNPLCGRNFEYYSEDPFLSGKIAAAMTNGVQSLKSCGTTVKHFACNNSEDDRMGSDSVVTERTLREIYLKGFEIAVRESQPLALMTSYNKVNGIHSANHYDLCTEAVRNEWHFRGIIMSDWCTTTDSPEGQDCTASGCVRAGNDLIMPGALADHENLRQEIKNGTLGTEDLRASAARIVDLALKQSEDE